MINMRKENLNKILVPIIVFLVTGLATYLVNSLRTNTYFTETLGLPVGTALIVIFFIIYFLSLIGLSRFGEMGGAPGIILAMIFVLVILVIDNGSGKSLKYTMKISPFYLSWLFGLIAGIAHYFVRKRSLLIPGIVLLFPLIMSLGGYDLWLHRIEYGNFSGSVNEQKVIPFKLFDKEGNVINNQTLKGKVVLFDFWFISCKPCWVKFPDLQRVYEHYESNPEVAIYAVNRPTSRDKPGELFSRIDEKEYTFPVLAGTQEIMDAFDIYVYPTVVLLNKEGEVIFMGELEDATETLKSLTN